MLKKELEQELNRTKLILDYARREIKNKDKEIERLRNELVKIPRAKMEYDLEIEKRDNIINITKSNIEITMQIIKEQTTGNDEWLLERLNGINNILKGK